MLLKRILKGSCLLLWLFCFILLGMAYQTQSGNAELEAKQYGTDSDQNSIYGRDRFTGILQPEVIANVQLARGQAVAGLGAGVAGLIMAIIVLRRERKRGRTSRKTSSGSSHVIPTIRSTSRSR